MTDTGLVHACVCLARDENFTRVSLRGTALTSLKGLARVRTLRCIDASLSRVTSDGLAALASLPALTRLVLVRCVALSSALHIGRLTSLEDLDVSACPIQDIAPLSAVRRLARLRADDTPIESLGSLATLTNLRWLSLRNVLAPVSEIECLAVIPTLEHLCLYNANVGEQVDFLSRFSSLGSLDVGCLRVRTADFSAGVPLLSSLALRHCPLVETILIQRQWATSLTSLDLLNASLLTDASVAGLDTLVELRTLVLAGTAITDRTVVDAVSGLAFLQRLDVSNTRVTTLSALAGSKRPLRMLRDIRAECCAGISEAGLRGLGHLPFLEVLDVSCTRLRWCTELATEPWLSLRELGLRGILRPPTDLAALCRRCMRLQRLDLRGCIHPAFPAVVHEIRQGTRYLHVCNVDDDNTMM